MSELVTAEQKQATIFDALEKMEPQFKLVLGKAIPAERFLRVCLTQMRRLPKLAECTKPSLLGAFMECASLNLEPGVNGACWLLPFRNKGTMEATFVIGYKGLLDLCWRSQMVSAVYADVVYDDDAFEWQRGTDAWIKHRPAGTTIDPDRITHAYAVIETIYSGKMFEVCTREQIDKVRDRSPSGQKATSPWTTDFAPMAKKTALKLVGKLAPTSTELARAIELDDLAEAGVAQHLGDVVDIGEVKSEPVTPPAEPPPAPAEPKGQDAPVSYRHNCGHTSNTPDGCNEVNCENGVPPDEGSSVSGDKCPGCNRHVEFLKDMGHAAGCTEVAP